MSKVYLNLFLIFIGLIVSLSAVSAGSFDSTQDGVLSIDGNSCYDSLNNNFGDNLSVGLDNYSIINTHNDNNINNITKNNITDNINNNELIQVNTNSNYSNFNCENINITVKNSNSSISNSNITLNNIDLILRNETLRNNLTKLVIIDNSTFIIKSKLSNVVIHTFDILTDDDFNKARYLVKCSDYKGYKLNYLVLNFKENSNFYVSNDDGSIFNPCVNLIINGNNASVIVRDPNLRHECHFLNNSNNMSVINNLKIEGFNTAIYNYAILIMSNVSFNNNKLDYYFKPDLGGAIINYGIVDANNCSFGNSYAKYGGAIYNQGILNITNCSFFDNKAYGDGNEIYNFDKGVVNIEGGNKDIVFYKKGRSTVSKWALRIGVGLVDVAVGVGLSLTGIGAFASIGLAALSGSLLGIAEGVYEGVQDHDLSLSYVTHCAFIYGSIGAFASSIATISLSESSVVATEMSEGSSVLSSSSSSMASSTTSSILPETLQFRHAVLGAFGSFTILSINGVIMLINYLDQNLNSSKV